jgi:hypothetical protein
VKPTTASANANRPRRVFRLLLFISVSISLSD